MVYWVWSITLQPHFTTRNYSEHFAIKEVGDKLPIQKFSRNIPVLRKNGTTSSTFIDLCNSYNFLFKYTYFINLIYVNSLEEGSFFFLHAIEYKNGGNKSPYNEFLKDPCINIREKDKE